MKYYNAMVVFEEISLNLILVAKCVKHQSCRQIEVFSRFRNSKGILWCTMSQDHVHLVLFLVSPKLNQFAGFKFKHLSGIVRKAYLPGRLKSCFHGLRKIPCADNLNCHNRCILKFYAKVQFLMQISKYFP